MDVEKVLAEAKGYTSPPPGYVATTIPFAVLAKCIVAIEHLQALPDACVAALPWPTIIWAMTDDDYTQMMPDTHQRTAISGFLMRKGWLKACEWMAERMKGGDV